jgi:hypothetical protein
MVRYTGGHSRILLSACVLAAFHAASAEGALAGIVAPGELVFAGLNVMARAVQRNLQMAHPCRAQDSKQHQAAVIPRLTGGRASETEACGAAPRCSTAW